MVVCLGGPSSFEWREQLRKGTSQVGLRLIWDRLRDEVTKLPTLNRRAALLVFGYLLAIDGLGSGDLRRRFTCTVSEKLSERS